MFLTHHIETGLSSVLMVSPSCWQFTHADQFTPWNNARAYYGTRHARKVYMRPTMHMALLKINTRGGSELRGNVLRRATKAPALDSTQI
jgi:hypothetical protein